ncbi:MAG: hypothetical protein P8Z42_06220 [Anaerolineales bacterium]
MQPKNERNTMQKIDKSNVVLILVLVLIAAVTGLYYRTQESAIEYVTIRGDSAVFQGSGLYRDDQASLAREAMIWDAINLLVAVPLLVTGIFLSSRKSLRGRLLLAGMLSYYSTSI